jgi:hypothetical protein
VWINLNPIVEDEVIMILENVVVVQGTGARAQWYKIFVPHQYLIFSKNR